jgi:uncharacterized protein (TIGR02145 family)
MDFKQRYQYNPSTDLLGRGGFATVYRAKDTLLGITVALKFFNSSSGDGNSSLVREIAEAMELNHKNLCRYFSLITEENTNFHGIKEVLEIGIMEYLDGGDIRSFIARNPDQLDNMLRDILKGLSYLHRNNRIHRDLKAQNILVKNTSEGPVAKITDFGTTKKLDSHQTRSSALVGTVEYMAPEQFNPLKYGVNGTLSTNVDLWSFGVMLYNLVTGKSLFGQRSGDTAAEEVMSRILSENVSSLLEDLPEPYRKIAQRCLVHHASERAQSASELLNLLDNLPAERTKDSNRTFEEKGNHKDETPADKADGTEEGTVTQLIPTSVEIAKTTAAPGTEHKLEKQDNPVVADKKSKHQGKRKVDISVPQDETANNAKPTKTDDGEMPGSNSGLVAKSVYSSIPHKTSELFSRVKTLSAPRKKVIWASGLVVLAVIVFWVSYGVLSPRVEKRVDVRPIEYPSVSIGNQQWMSKNLNVTRFRNGDTIMVAKTEEDWKMAGEQKKPACCNYGFYSVGDSTGNDWSESEHGKLYNFYAVSDPRGLAPKGWHIPTDLEFAHLIESSGGRPNAGVALKNPLGWLPSNATGTNVHGFAAMPGGVCDEDGNFKYFGTLGVYWSSSVASDKSANRLELMFDKVAAGYSSAPMQKGYSVRCLQDTKK